MLTCLRKISLPILIYTFCATGSIAQVTLLSEDFNGCALPAGWQVNITGNQNPVWYVGLSQNNDSPGQSIDGSCFLLIDDEATGNNTPGYVIDFVSPPFDASTFATVLLTMDVHYRDWEDANEFLQILVSDGATQIPLSRFDRYRKNSSQIADHFALRYDLALVTQSPTARLIIRYNDANGAWNWWAGVDNIKITGSDEGTNVIKETFNACALPAGWETEILAGPSNWSIGTIQTGSNALQGGSSMDGTCFAYFDDDALGDVTGSKIRLSTPWFDGTQFGKFTLNYDAILRYYKESLSIIVKNGNGAEFVLQNSQGNIGGPNFPAYEHFSLDLSPYRAQQMRVIFEYDDGDDWGWWVGIDNVKITGLGQSLDICSNAAELSTGAPCLPGDNRSATFEGPAVTCSGSSMAGIWYRWQADFTGTARLTTHAAFNDVVNVFTGSCASPVLVACDNRDEHGFTGETTYFPVQSGTQYLFRISGQDGPFGLPRGDLCVEIDPAVVPNAPVNDDCDNAVALTANGACVIGSNVNASMSATLPSLNLLARSDIWYKFTAGNLAAGEKLEFQSNASFSDVITLYSGGCAALNEIAGEHRGSALEMPALTAGQTYWVQVAGNFASVEGSICPQLLIKQTNAPANDNCAGATTVAIGGACVAANILNATASGYKPSCVTAVTRDLWFRFTAPPSGSIQFNTGAAFEHALAIWEGDCSALTQVYCIENPKRCDGFFTAVGLDPGQPYFIQIAAWNGAGGNGSGDLCLKILDGLSQPDFQPLVLEAEANCTGAGMAELSVVVSGGVPPYTFSGNTNGQMLTSGTFYLAVATDAIGCEQMAEDTVGACLTGGCLLTAAISATAPKCSGSSDGALSANVTSGTAPFIYLWSNGAGTPVITGLPAGIYSLTVTDVNGCSAMLSKTLTGPSPLLVTHAANNPKCNGNADGSLTVAVEGGTTPYEYLWSNNATTSAITGLTAGAYSVIVSDANGCSISKNLSLADPALLVVNPSVVQPACFGEMSGAVHANASGGTGPYIYQWSNGFVTPSIEDLAAGVYTLTLTDARGCSTTSSQTLSDPPVLVVTPGPITEPGQGQSNGAIHVTVAGGTPPYQYTWFRNNLQIITGVEDLDNIPSGNYRLEIVDANDCTTVFNYTLMETVGTRNPGEAFYAAVFPNPASEKAVLAVVLPRPQVLQLSITDASGRLLSNWEVEVGYEQDIPLDLRDVPGGTYRLRIVAGSDVVSRSIVVGK